MVITGYRLKNVTDITVISEEIKKLQRAVKTRREKVYHELLGEEIAFLCDNVALNILNRNQGEDIFECAIRNVNKRVHTASVQNLNSKNNLQVFVQVMTLKDDTYFKVLCQNDRILKAFRHLEDFSLSEEECRDKKNGKNETWQELHAIYKTVPPMTVNLATEIIPDREKLVYPDKKVRCQNLARWQMTSECLNRVAGGEQIPPFLLMRYMDDAMEMVLSDECKMSLMEKELRLQNILVDLSADDSFVFPKEDDDILAE